MKAEAISVDVGGTTTKLGLCAAGGDLRLRREIPTPHDPATLVALLREHVIQIDTEAGADPHRPLGVVVPGIVDEDKGVVVRAVNLGWQDLPLRAMLAEATGRDVTLGHDVRAGTVAETRWGAGDEDLLFVALGTGIAAGLVLGGRLVRGGGYAGEIGQVPVRPAGDDRPIPLEHLASATGLARRLAERRTYEIAHGARGVFALAEQGDPHARCTIDQAVTALADVLAALLCLTGPLAVVVGGGLSKAGEALLAPLRTAVAERLSITPQPSVTRTRLDSWAQCMGAGALALDQVATHR